MSVDIGTDTLLCKGENYIVTAIADSSAVNYYWSINGTPVPTQDTFLIINSSIMPPGDYDVEITVDDGSAMVCPGYDKIKVTIVDMPSVNLGADTTICDGQSIILDAGAGTLYLWNTGETTQTITISQTGWYSVTVDGGNGTRCLDTNSMNLFVAPMPVVNLGLDTCSETSFIIDAGNPGMYYSWAPYGQTTQTIQANVTGIYSVTVSSLPNGLCNSSASKDVKIIPTPIINLKDTTICKHHNLTLDITQPGTGYSYQWLPSGSNNSYYIISGFQPGEYTIVANITGCKTVTDSLKLKVEPCDLIIPNVITPNGDGFNDYFYIPNLNFYPNSSIVIFNRWGKKVYESSNYQNDWDGENHSDGVYYFILNINYGSSNNSNDEIKQEIHGIITVIGKNN